VPADSRAYLAGRVAGSPLRRAPANPALFG